MNNVKMSICVYFNQNLKYADNVLKKIHMSNFHDIEVICILDKSFSLILKKINDYKQFGMNIKIIFNNENIDLLDVVNGDYILILSSNNLYSNLNLKELYVTSKNSNLDILLFQPDFVFENFENIDNHTFNIDVNHQQIFNLPKYINNLYRISFLKNYSLTIPVNTGLFDCLNFYFKSLFLASKVIFSDKQIFNKRFINEFNIHEYILTDFRFKEIFNSDHTYELNIENFFDNIFKLYTFFKEESLYFEYKYDILNYFFNLFFNIYNFDILNKIEYFVFLKKFINNISQEIHSDLVLNLKPSFLKFYRYVLISNSLSEIELRYSYEELLIFNEKLKFKQDKMNYFAQKFLMGRLDIKNNGNKDNKVEIIDISDKNAISQFPPWLKDDNGVGFTINSDEGLLDITLRCINDGVLDIILRGMDLRDINNSRVPIFIDFSRMEINDEVIFDDNVLVHHDNPFKFSKSVKDGDLIKIHVEWTSLTDNSSFDYKVFSKNDGGIGLNTLDEIFSARFDIKNNGNEFNSVKLIDISDKNAVSSFPSWLEDSAGKGIMIRSSKGVITLCLKCINDGELNICLRGMDFRSVDNSRIPIFINFYSLKINDEIIMDENNIVFHDKPFEISRFVKDGELIHIHAEWIPLNNIIRNKFS